MLRKWDDLPDYMKCEEVRPYYDVLKKHQCSLLLKRIFDVFVALILLVILAIPMMVISVMIKTDSSGPIMFRQERVTTYGKRFRIHKFRTMVNHADKLGSGVTVENDIRITKMGNKLRNLRLDELPQLFDVLSGNMSFVGTRPESAKYVEQYLPEYYATLLLPAGITSEASIQYKDEAKMLESATDVDQMYLQNILPEKMKINLNGVLHFSLLNEARTMFRTIYYVVN